MNTLRGTPIELNQLILLLIILMVVSFILPTGIPPGLALKNILVDFLKISPKGSFRISPEGFI